MEGMKQYDFFLIYLKQYLFTRKVSTISVGSKPLKIQCEKHAENNKTHNI